MFMTCDRENTRRLILFSFEKSLVNCETPGHTRQLSAGKQRRKNYASLNLVHSCRVDRGGYSEIRHARAHDNFLDNRARHHRIDHRRRGYPHVFAPDNRTISSRRPYFFHTWRDPGSLCLHQAEYPFPPRSLRASSSTVSSPAAAVSCGRNPIVAFLSIAIVCLSGETSTRRSANKVDLPALLGPTNPIRSPRLTWSDTSSKSARPAKDFESCETVSIPESAQCSLVRCPAQLVNHESTRMNTNHKSICVRPGSSRCVDLATPKAFASR